MGASLLNEEDLPESSGANKSDYLVALVVRLILLIALASCASVQTLSILRLKCFESLISVRGGLNLATTGLVAAPNRASFYVFAFG